MSNQEEQLTALKDIRNMMDRSSRFISLSGLSGVFAGLTALCGAFLAHREINSYIKAGEFDSYNEWNLEFTLLEIGFSVLCIAIAGGLLFTYRKSRQKNLPFWDKTARNLMINLAIPLVAGGCFILSLLIAHPNTYGLIAPVCLLFYGLALVNASKYTYTDIRFLGICEIVLGLISLFNIGYGLYFWATGFGLLHIFYGALMYFKYERAK
ncbi:MAG TPA: hypothetical protein VKB19_16905 [Pedobacter sp.]|nr:hypothetical protein [Pedobacter sp.]